MNGSHKGSVTFIPRIDLIPENSNFPFNFKRRQLPVSLAYFMTINKSQGQSLQKVVVFLKEPVFGHGQLYVALSRAMCHDKLKLVIDNVAEKQEKYDGKYYTKNVVFKEVLSSNEL